MKRYIVVRPENTVEVLIMRNRSDNTYSYINLTHDHICECRFKTIDEAIADMDRLKSEGKIIRYEEIPNII